MRNMPRKLKLRMVAAALFATLAMAAWSLIPFARDVLTYINPLDDSIWSYVYIDDGRGGFADRRPIGPSHSSTRSVAIADLNGDSFGDIILGDPHNGGAHVYINDGAAAYTTSFGLGRDMGHVYSIATADVDADGDIDVIFGNRLAPGAILLNEDDGNEFSVVKFGDGAGAVYGLAIGDIDREEKQNLSWHVICAFSSQNQE